MSKKKALWVAHPRRKAKSPTRNHYKIIIFILLCTFCQKSYCLCHTIKIAGASATSHPRRGPKEAGETWEGSRVPARPWRHTWQGFGHRCPFPHSWTSAWPCPESHAHTLLQYCFRQWENKNSISALNFLILDQTRCVEERERERQRRRQRQRQRQGLDAGPYAVQRWIL